MKARVRLLIAVGAVLAVAAAWFFGTIEPVHQRIEAALPPRPNLSAAAPEFVARLAAADAAAHRRWKGVEGLKTLGRLYHANGFLVEAVQVYEGLMAVDPANARWPHLLGLIHTGFGEMDEGLPLLQKAVVLNPEYGPARLKLGDALFKQSRFADAAAQYAELVARQPGNAYGLLGIARCELEAGHLTAAGERLREAVRADPKFAAGWTTLATVNERQGNLADAAACRETGAKAGRFREMADPWADELIDDCYDVYRLRIAAATADGLASTRRLLERAVALAPTNAALHRQLASTLVEMGEIGRARVHYQRAVTLDPTDADSWAYYVQVLNTMGEVAASDEALAEGMLRCPTSPSLHYERGRRLVRRGEFAAAAAEFGETRRLRPQEANASIELALIAFRQGQPDRAVAELYAALAAEPEHPFALEALTKAAIEAGDEPAAREWLQRVRHQPRVPAQTANALGNEYRERFGRSP